MDLGESVIYKVNGRMWDNVWFIAGSSVWNGVSDRIWDRVRSRMWRVRDKVREVIENGIR
jgi:hypothetical protein